MTAWRWNRTTLQLEVPPYTQLKDPCPAHDGVQWHMFGTAIDSHGFSVLHATADRLEGPWTIREPVNTGSLSGGCVGAPGAVAEGPQLHIFLQTEYNVLGGRIEHMVSDDGGWTFQLAATALTSLPGTAEAGVYDPHPCIVAGQKYLVYSAFSTVGQPDVHIARSSSGTWDGPWERLGPVVRHEQVWCHNQRGASTYEWGLEGAQLVELPDGRVLLNAVCFLPAAAAGTRQRVFLGIGHDVLGPYDILGPALVPSGGDAAGENGHATVVVDGQDLALLFQERSLDDPIWHLGLARAPLYSSSDAHTAAQQAVPACRDADAREEERG